MAAIAHNEDSNSSVKENSSPGRNKSSEFSGLEGKMSTSFNPLGRFSAAVEIQSALLRKSVNALSEQIDEKSTDPKSQSPFNRRRPQTTQAIIEVKKTINLFRNMVKADEKAAITACLSRIIGCLIDLCNKCEKSTTTLRDGEILSFSQHVKEILQIVGESAPGPFDSDLLAEWAPLFMAMFNTKVLMMRSTAVTFWIETFGKTTGKLRYPEGDFREKMSKELKKKNMTMPAAEVEPGACSFEEEMSTFELSQQANVEALAKKLMPAQNTKKPVGDEGMKSPTMPKAPTGLTTTPKSTKRGASTPASMKRARERMLIDEDSIDFVPIVSSPASQKKNRLTDHQREKFEEACTGVNYLNEESMSASQRWASMQTSLKESNFIVDSSQSAGAVSQHAVNIPDSAKTEEKDGEKETKTKPPAGKKSPAKVKDVDEEKKKETVVKNEVKEDVVPVKLEEVETKTEEAEAATESTAEKPEEKVVEAVKEKKEETKKESTEERVTSTSTATAKQTRRLFSPPDAKKLTKKNSDMSLRKRKTRSEKIELTEEDKSAECVSDEDDQALITLPPMDMLDSTTITNITMNSVDEKYDSMQWSDEDSPKADDKDEKDNNTNDEKMEIDEPMAKRRKAGRPKKIIAAQTPPARKRGTTPSKQKEEGKKVVPITRRSVRKEKEHAGAEDLKEKTEDNEQKKDEDEKKEVEEEEKKTEELVVANENEKVVEDVQMSTPVKNNEQEDEKKSETVANNMIHELSQEAATTSSVRPMPATPSILRKSASRFGTPGNSDKKRNRVHFDADSLSAKDRDEPSSAVKIRRIQKVPSPTKTEVLTREKTPPASESSVNSNVNVEVEVHVEKSPTKKTSGGAIDDLINDSGESSVLFPSLIACDEPIEALLKRMVPLKGVITHTAMLKAAVSGLGVKTVGQFAALTCQQINKLVSIRQVRQKTARQVLSEFEQHRRDQRKSNEVMSTAEAVPSVASTCVAEIQKTDDAAKGIVIDVEKTPEAVVTSEPEPSNVSDVPKEKEVETVEKKEEVMADVTVAEAAEKEVAVETQNDASVETEGVYEKKVETVDEKVDESQKNISEELENVNKPEPIEVDSDSASSEAALPVDKTQAIVDAVVENVDVLDSDTSLPVEVKTDDADSEKDIVALAQSIESEVRDVGGVGEKTSIVSPGDDNKFMEETSDTVGTTMHKDMEPSSSSLSPTERVVEASRQVDTTTRDLLRLVAKTDMTENEWEKVDDMLFDAFTRLRGLVRDRGFKNV